MGAVEYSINNKLLGWWVSKFRGFVCRMESSVIAGNLLRGHTAWSYGELEKEFGGQGDGLEFG